MKVINKETRRPKVMIHPKSIIGLMPLKISDKKVGTILDPFIGSGTTVRVAKKLTDNNQDYNLSGIGIDIDEKYIEYCKESIKN